MCVCVCVCVCACAHVHMYMSEYYPIFFVYFSFDEHLGSFLTLAAVHNAIMNMGIYICLQDTDFASFRYIFESGVAGSRCSSVFNVLWNLHTTFHSDCTNLRASSSIQGFTILHTSVSICNLFFLIIHILIDVRWEFIFLHFPD